MKCHLQVGLVDEQMANCVICGNELKSNHPLAILCSEKCRNEHTKLKKYKRPKRLGNPRTYHNHCPICDCYFETKRWNRIYCDEKCSAKAKEKQVNHTKEEMISALRKDYNILKETDLTKAQQIADEMEILEGKVFRKLALNGLAPFDKKENDKMAKGRKQGII